MHALPGDDLKDAIAGSIGRLRRMAPERQIDPVLSDAPRLQRPGSSEGE